MQEVFLQEKVYFTVVVERGAALFQMLNPIKTCILHLWRKTLCYDPVVCINHKRSRPFDTAYILLQVLGHELHAFYSKHSMRLLLLDPEPRIPTSCTVKEEVAERRMMQPDRAAWLVGNIKDCM